jgi:hypothetical protein
MVACRYAAMGRPEIIFQATLKGGDKINAGQHLTGSKFRMESILPQTARMGEGAE